MTTAGCVLSACSHSLSRRLSRKLALLTMCVLGVLSASVYLSVKMLVVQRNAEAVERHCTLLSTLLQTEARLGGEPAVLARLQGDAVMRTGAHLQLWRADGTPFFSDPSRPDLLASRHVQYREFELPLPAISDEPLRARYSVDFSADARMGERWALILILTTLGAGGIVAIGSGWHVRRALRPLRELAAQTQQISPQQLHQRLELADPAEELQPLMLQFNGLMDRLERAYLQLEGFNADVAHELRTPLATLIGHAELALSRERTSDELRDTLEGSLEELQRLTGLVNDMLFLASADRGATARRGEPVSLADVVRQVAEFHEAALEDNALAVRVEGDARVPVDEPLLKRALSNLMGNATRYAAPGSTVAVRIDATAPRQIRVLVENAGPTIEPEHLPRLFDRFFRADSSRQCPQGTGDTLPVVRNHGLGLAIVSAIARMHGGTPAAESTGGLTRIGFTLSTGPALVR
jgi:two-component system, OmpR family, heavy metal sensor histidine kinase CusS